MIFGFKNMDHNETSFMFLSHIRSIFGDEKLKLLFNLVFIFVVTEQKLGSPSVQNFAFVSHDVTIEGEFNWRLIGQRRV